MITFNCNHFTDEFLVKLLGRGLPRKLNRAAYFGSFLHCLIPKKYLTVTPDEPVVKGKCLEAQTPLSARTAAGPDSTEDDIDEDSGAEEGSTLLSYDSKSSPSKRKHAGSCSTTSQLSVNKDD